MNNKLRLAQELYFTFRQSIKEGHLSEADFNAIIDNHSEPYRLTNFELRGARPEFKEFVIKNDFLVSAINTYGYTEPYQDFSYSFDRLNLHLKFSEIAFDTLYYVAESNFESVLEDFEISKNDELSDPEIFEEKLNLTRDEIIFEQSLISLLTIFEAYITHILQWIFQKDESARRKIRVNINYDEVLQNIDEIYDFLILKKIEQIRSWDDRINTIQGNPIRIQVKNKAEYKLIKDAIVKRNVLIHHKGIVNTRFLKEIKNNDISKFNVKNDYSVDDKIKIKRPYYYQVQGAIHNLVIFIDDKVKEKYA